MQGTWEASGDTLEITGEDDLRTMSLKFSGLSGLRLERDSLPISLTIGEDTAVFGLDGLQDQDQTVGCRRV